MRAAYECCPRGGRFAGATILPVVEAYLRTYPNVFTVSTCQEEMIPRIPARVMLPSRRLRKRRSGGHSKHVVIWNIYPARLV